MSSIECLVALQKHLDEKVNRASFGDNGAIVNADGVEVLQLLPSQSVDLCIIDPPYGNQTHGQNNWDVAWRLPVWVSVVDEVFRVLTAGGHFVVFANGSTQMAIVNSIFEAHANLAKTGRLPSDTKLGYYPMVWVHHSQDSGRCHSHTPRSQFEFVLVFYRKGEGKMMISKGMLGGPYQPHVYQHVGRTNVLDFYKDDDLSKPYPTVRDFFRTSNQSTVTFDYKPEGLMRALISDFSRVGGMVVDMCARHCITAVAAELQCRKFVCVEICPVAYGRAVSRFREQFSHLSSFNAPPTIALDDASSVSDHASEQAGVENDGPEQEDADESDEGADKLDDAGADKLDDELDEIAGWVNIAGLVVDVGTPKKTRRLLVYEKVNSIDDNLYNVADVEIPHKIITLTIKRKAVQGVFVPSSQQEKYVRDWLLACTSVSRNGSKVSSIPFKQRPIRVGIAKARGGKTGGGKTGGGAKTGGGLAAAGKC